MQTSPLQFCISKTLLPHCSAALRRKKYISIYITIGLVAILKPLVKEELEAKSSVFIRSIILHLNGCCS